MIPAVYQSEEQEQEQEQPKHGQQRERKILEQRQDEEQEEILERQQELEQEKMLEQIQEEEPEDILEQQAEEEQEKIFESELQQEEEHENKLQQNDTESVSTTTEGQEYMRNLTVFIRPREDTVLAEPEPSPCRDRQINLVLVVISAPANFLERSTIRRTWGEEIVQYPGVSLLFLLGRDYNNSQVHVSFHTISTPSRH